MEVDPDGSEKSCGEAHQTGGSDSNEKDSCDSEEEDNTIIDIDDDEEVGDVNQSQPQWEEAQTPRHSACVPTPRKFQNYV